MSKTKLPDFSIDPTWVKLKKDMGIKLSKKEIKVLKKGSKKND